MRTGKVLGPEVVLIYVYGVPREYARVLNDKMRVTGMNWRNERCVRKLEFVEKNARNIEAAIPRYSSREPPQHVAPSSRARTSHTSRVDYLTSRQSISSDKTLTLRRPPSYYYTNPLNSLHYTSSP